MPFYVGSPFLKIRHCMRDFQYVDMNRNFGDRLIHTLGSIDIWKICTLTRMKLRSKYHFKKLNKYIYIYIWRPHGLLWMWFNPRYYCYETNWRQLEVEEMCLNSGQHQELFHIIKQRGCRTFFEVHYVYDMLWPMLQRQISATGG